MNKSRAYMKGAGQSWLPFVDAIGIVLQVLEPVKAAAWDWLKSWKAEFCTKQAKPAINKGLVFLDQFRLPVFSQPRLI